ncbi:MAG TPA: saccharopine dehydrogenase NADP-binding domain-containing protein [Candidatus Anoxymicrobiaceae bacterium]
MSKITVLGGCGGIGSVAVKTLDSSDFFDEIVIGEKRYDAACEAAESLSDKVSAIEVDADDPASLKAAIEGSKIVLNTVGPFYTYGPPILMAAIEAGVDYVDVCDDLDATERMLELDGEAKAAGISALIGMGNSPGMANVIARWCADTMLDQVEEVNIYHAHGGEPSEGGGVIKHRIHAMTSDIPLFVDGEFITVRMLEESGRKFVTETEFKGIGTYPVYPYPHPETITMPKNIEGIKRVTNMGFVLPLDYFQLTMDTVALGICTEEPLVVQGREVVPIEFAVQYIISRRPGFIEAAGLTEPTGCLKVEVKGVKDGDPHAYVFSMFSKGAGAGEGTGIPAAIGAVMMNRGQITEKGVFPPEAGVVPTDMLELAGQVLRGTSMGEGGVPIYIEHIDKDGNSQSIDFNL